MPQWPVYKRSKPYPRITRKLFVTVNQEWIHCSRPHQYSQCFDLKNVMPQVDAEGRKLEVSHLCHNGLCIKGAHLTLESHEIFS